jgi:hypothetical protein
MRSQRKINRHVAARSHGRGGFTPSAIYAAAAIIIASAVLWYRSDSGAESIVHRYERAATPITLDPQAFGGEARETYRIARNRPDLLAKLHCYCHCDVRLGHRNLLDCYRDPHAASCGICMGEARDADEMAKRGASMDEIRDTLRSRYENSE